MKKYHTLLVVAITILVVVLLTWILPITYLNSGEVIEGERVQAGIFSVGTYGLYTFYNFIYVFLGLLLIGGLYGILNKTSAYRVLLDRLVKHVNNHKILYLILAVLFISFLVAFAGLTYEMLVFLPLIAAVVILLGYDKMIAAMVTVGSVSVGVIGSLFSKNVVGKLTDVLEGTKYTDLILPKAIILVLCAAALIVYIALMTKYLEDKNGKNEKIEESFLVPKKVNEKNVKVWPLVTIFAVGIIVMVLATIDWTGAFNVSFFDDALTTIKGWSVLSKYIVLAVGVFVVLYNILTSVYKRAGQKDQKLMSTLRWVVTIVFAVFAFLALLKIMLEDVFKATDIMSKALESVKVKDIIDGFTFDKLLGSVVAFGKWSYNEYMILLLLVCLAIKYAYHIKFSEVIENMGDGFKNVLYGCIVAMLSYTILILMASHPVGLTLIYNKVFLKATEGFNILTYPLSTLISGLFNTDFAYYEYGVLNVSYVATAYTGSGVLPLAEFITQTMYGFAMLIAPTSVVLLFTLSLLDVKYTTWLKRMLILLGVLLVILFGSFIVLKLWVV